MNKSSILFLIIFVVGLPIFSEPDRTNGFASIPGKGLEITTGGEGGKTVNVYMSSP